MLYVSYYFINGLVFGAAAHFCKITVWVTDIVIAISVALSKVDSRCNLTGWNSALSVRFSLLWMQVVIVLLPHMRSKSMVDYMFTRRERM
jgi:hypothetical protein